MLNGDRGDPVYFYAVYHTTDGGYGFEVMSKKDIEKHRDRYSRAKNNGPWRSDFEAMAKKTVLKQVLKYAPLKTDFIREVISDESVKNIEVDAFLTDEKVDVIDMPNEVEYEVEGDASIQTEETTETVPGQVTI